MSPCHNCGHPFDHRMLTRCPQCGVAPVTLQAARHKINELRAQVTQLQQHNTEMVERCRALTAGKEILLGRIGRADEARDLAIQEMSAYARRCGELEAQLCGQLVEHPGRKAMLLVLAELRRGKMKYPLFANGIEQGLVYLLREVGELAAAIIKNDLDGEHGVKREAAQVAAVAVRIIEFCGGENHRRCGDCGRPAGFERCDSCRFASDHPLWIPKPAPTAVCTCGTCMACQDSGLGR